MPKDPVCGMEITEAEAAGKSEYKGRTYYFCAPGCKKMFDKNPKRHVRQGTENQHPTEDHQVDDRI